METSEVFIERRLDTGTSFGVRLDNGESVFINARVAKKYDIAEDQTRTMVVLPNTGEDSSKTPWKAMTVSMTETIKDVKNTPPIEGDELRVRIIGYLTEEPNQFAHTALELAKKLRVDVSKVQQTLTQMHDAGEMSKACVYAKGGQEEASTVLWARAVDWFSL